jgi:hypothetical protein
MIALYGGNKQVYYLNVHETTFNIEFYENKLTLRGNLFIIAQGQYQPTQRSFEIEISCENLLTQFLTIKLLLWSKKYEVANGIMDKILDALFQRAKVSFRDDRYEDNLYVEIFQQILKMKDSLQKVDEKKEEDIYFLFNKADYFNFENLELSQVEIE